MRKILSYDISELVPYINWLYFYHAWGLSGKPQEEKKRMQEEAFEMLRSWESKFHTHAIFRLLSANGDGDDILVYPYEDEGKKKFPSRGGNDFVRIPMLRQQRPTAEGKPNLCLADFIHPLGKKDKIGLFCTTVDGAIADLYRKDDYKSMLAQTLCDRLAEATAERMHGRCVVSTGGMSPTSS